MPTKTERVDQQRRRQPGGRRGGPRLPAVAAVLVAIVLYLALPTKILAGPRFVVPILELGLVVTLIAINPARVTTETRLSRGIAIALVLVIAIVNLFTLGKVIDALLASKINEGKNILLAAFDVWMTNIIVFGLAYWELDRGGPVKRAHSPRGDLPNADFRFSQDENDDAVEEVARGSSTKTGWVPGLLDYLYVSLTNSSAFSPTDTMPLTQRAKALMGIQATAALVTSILVISRGVGILK